MINKSMTVLGSTGSIGTQALSVAEYGGIKIDALSLGKNIKLGEEQIRKFGPKYCAVLDEKAAHELRVAVADTATVILSGTDGPSEMISLSGSDICLNAISGFAGLRPTLTALKYCKRLALANKESLVAAGDIVMSEAEKRGCEIIPVDSEHSAIFQCLKDEDKRHVRRLILTCSGGAFFGKKREELAAITPEMALGHPTWRMGPKITVDCATLMNKGLEVIEAMHLFGMPSDKIDVVIHRESIIHSMVEYTDKAVIAQLGMPDMRLPIQYAVTYPERLDSPCEPLDFVKTGKLSFYEPDTETFSLLALAKRTAVIGGILPCVMNAANEEAVSLFLSGKISFLDIFSLTEETVGSYKNISVPTIDDIESANTAARIEVAELAAIK